MKIKALLLFLIVLTLTPVFAQEATDPDLENAAVTIAPQDLEIQIKALMPDISMIKIKTDTYAQPGNYNYTINLSAIQKESKTQLINWKQQINNWLEESK
jgi:hypothetical protein